MMQQNQEQRHSSKRKRAQRGMGLVATMLVLMGIMAMMLIGVIGGSGGKSGGSVVDTAKNAVQSSGARSRSAASFNMAEAGIQYTIAWLSTQSAPPANTQAFAPGLNFGAGAAAATVGTPPRAQIIPDPTNDPSTYFTVRVYPDSYNNVTNSSTSTAKKYLIESVGVSGGMTTILQVYVRQGSLSQYLVLLNSWNNSNNFWVSGLTTFDGPVHDNNANGVAENVFWTDNHAATQMFTYTGSDAYSVSGTNGINYWENWQQNTPPQVLTNPGPPPTTNNQWLDIAAGGAPTIAQGTPVVPFPTSSAIQKNAATNGRSSLNATGASLCPGGGVYIEGNVDEMVMSTSGANNTTQVMTITQGTLVQRITIDPTAGTTTLETKKVNGNGNGNGQWNTTETLPNSTTNGVVYVDGNIGAQGDPKTGGLHGTVADNSLDASGNLVHNNALTIATPQTANTNLDGSITYNTHRTVAKDSSGNPIYTDVNGNRTNDPTKGTPTFVTEDHDPTFTSQAGTLGVISNNVLVTKNDSSGNPLNSFEMDGTVLASGIYDADHFTDRPVGLWENMGGYLSSTVGTFGVFGNNLQLTNGFNTQFNYDARMRNNPPPFFPTTGNQYNIVSWQQVTQTIE